MAHYGPTNPPYAPELNRYEAWCTECQTVCFIDDMMPEDETCWPCWSKKEPDEQAKYGDMAELRKQYNEWRDE